MSRYSVDFDPGEDDRMAEWIVVEDTEVRNGVTIGRILYRTTDREAAETICQEFMILEAAEEYNSYNDQLTEFDYV